MINIKNPLPLMVRVTFYTGAAARYEFIIAAKSGLLAAVEPGEYALDIGILDEGILRQGDWKLLEPARSRAQIPSPSLGDIFEAMRRKEDANT